ncbi:AraC family transcriptional regulator [Marinomonas sp. A79]|uniref:AraC family transcriptional regulator n=1 Tax=Marinomonas vulgaris TaxID=2823372 RepID=A0ABS5H8W1_9GAMM|nr:AraC family transcriptional regulator [Marinomonas vulgaris]MBR7888128.1 AraC family transcriptional regulator [Marinomonas vulgaris]
MPKQNTFTRIEKVLDYLHEHLDETINVADLAEKSCWSRWQFQRVFGQATGITVAQYIRELRLSKAAELLLSSKTKHLDIAILCGFDSEISFSRAFKQFFHCTPREYRLRGKRQGLRTPLCPRENKHQDDEKSPLSFTQIRIESHDAFHVQGKHDWISGLFSSSPNFLERVPKLWQALNPPTMLVDSIQPIGVIDTRDQVDHPNQLHYWAGFLTHAPNKCPSRDLDTLQVPPQEYAVIPVQGKVAAIEKNVAWCLSYWLPQSNYDGISGYELEKYEPGYDPKDPSSYMEYWLPIRPR